MVFNNEDIFVKEAPYADGYNMGRQETSIGTA